MGATPRYPLIVFDWDGTLADSTQAIARSIQAACVDMGCPAPTLDAARHVIGLGLHEAMPIWCRAFQAVTMRR